MTSERAIAARTEASNRPGPLNSDITIQGEIPVNGESKTADRNRLRGSGVFVSAWLVGPSLIPVPSVVANPNISWAAI